MPGCQLFSSLFAHLKINLSPYKLTTAWKSKQKKKASEKNLSWMHVKEEINKLALDLLIASSNFFMLVASPSWRLSSGFVVCVKNPWVRKFWLLREKRQVLYFDNRNTPFFIPGWWKLLEKPGDTSSLDALWDQLYCKGNSSLQN